MTMGCEGNGDSWRTLSSNRNPNHNAEGSPERPCLPPNPRVTNSMRFPSLLLAGLIGMGALAAEDAPDALTWKNFEEVSRYAAQSPAELRYQDLTWHQTVFDAQREAHVQDRPLLLCLYFGGTQSAC